MINMLIRSMIDAAQTPKGVYAATGATGASWILTVLEWIPNDIGKFISLIGLIIAVWMFYIQYKKDQRDQERHVIEMELLKKERKD